MFRNKLWSVKSLVTVFKKTMSTRDLRYIFQSSVQAVLPGQLIRKEIQLRGSHLVVRNQQYELKKPCYVVGFGKAVLAMANEVEKTLGDHLQRGVVTVPVGIFNNNSKLENNKIEFVEGARNNLPDREAMQGALKIRELVEKLTEEDLLIVLISGGGSALLPLPIPPVTLEEKQELIRKLSKKGADIFELNTVRKQLSVLKGGGLSRLAHPCKIISLILSDIVGDPLSFIASGPTIPNSDPTGSGMEVLKKYYLDNGVSESIRNVLERKEKGGLEKDIPIVDGEYEHTRNYIIGNNTIAAQAALHSAQLKGYQAAIVSTAIEGDVQIISRIYAQLAYHLARLISNCRQENKKSLECFLNGDFRDVFRIKEGFVDEVMKMPADNGICLILAGEPTVEVKGNGKGGRNQQLALAFSLELNNLDSTLRKSVDISFLSCGTDGMDGPTDAAGAISDLGEVEGDIDPQKYLKNNDSYSFYEAYKDGQNLVRIGHTGTNVMDIHVMVLKPKYQCQRNER